MLFNRCPQELPNLRQRSHVEQEFLHGEIVGPDHRHISPDSRGYCNGTPAGGLSSGDPLLYPARCSTFQGKGLHLNTNAVKSFFTQAESSAHQVARSTGGIGRSGRFARSNQRGPLGILKVGSHAGCKEAGYGRRSAPCAPGALFFCGIPVSVPQPGSSSRFLCEAE